MRVEENERKLGDKGAKGVLFSLENLKTILPHLLNYSHKPQPPSCTQSTRSQRFTGIDLSTSTLPVTRNRWNSVLSQQLLVLFSHHPQAQAPLPKKEEEEVPGRWGLGEQDTRARGHLHRSSWQSQSSWKGQFLKTRYIRQVQPDGEDDAQPQGQAEGNLGHPKSWVICPQLKTV